MDRKSSSMAELLQLGAMGCVALSGLGLLVNLLDYFITDQEHLEATNIVTGEQENLEAEPVIPIGLAVALGLIGVALAVASVLVARGASAGTQPPPAPVPPLSQTTAAGQEPAPQVATTQAAQSAPATAPDPPSIQQAEVARARRGEVYAVAGLAITVGQIIVTGLF
jgi:hypothetical protein